jgi:hypothetical protein
VLAKLGVEEEAIRAERRPDALRCLDWSERRPHVAGALGAAVCAQAFAQGWVERRPGSRAVRITLAGRTAFRTALGLQV